jgi:hypothetical protein
MLSRQLTLMVQGCPDYIDVVSSASSSGYNAARTVAIVDSDNTFTNQQNVLLKKLLLTLMFGVMEGKLEMTLGRFCVRAANSPHGVR